jgi:hypothetical protein
MKHKTIVSLVFAVVLPILVAAHSSASANLKRFSIATGGGYSSTSGNAAEFVNGGGAFSIRLSYNKKSTALGNTSYSLYYVLSRHLAKNDEEGTDYTFHRGLFTFGSHYLISRFDLNCGFGGGLLVSHWRTEDESGSGGTFLFGGGLGAEYYVADRVSVGVNADFWHGSYLKPTYYYAGYNYKSQVINFLDIFGVLKFHFGNRSLISKQSQVEPKPAEVVPYRDENRPPNKSDQVIEKPEPVYPTRWKLGFGGGGFTALLMPSLFSAQEEHGARNLFFVPIGGKAWVQYCKTGTTAKQNSPLPQNQGVSVPYLFYRGVRVGLAHFSSSEMNTSNTWRGGSHQDSRSILSGNSLNILGVVGGGRKHLWDMKVGLTLAYLRSEVTRTDVFPNETSDAKGVSFGVTFGVGYNRRLSNHIFWRILDFESTLFVNHQLNLYDFHSPFHMLQLGSELVFLP